MKKSIRIASLLAFAIANTAFINQALAADSLNIDIHAATEQGQGAHLGKITVEETAYGLLFTPHLKDLAPGIHGFHIHDKPDCGPSTDAQGKVTPAGAAGGHMDSEKTDKHLGPYNQEGHLGDLPAVYVDADGTAAYPVLAPKLTKVSQIKNRSIMIHAGGDNHSDDPAPLGGGGARMACGVIK